MVQPGWCIGLVDGQMLVPYRPMYLCCHFTHGKESGPRQASWNRFRHPIWPACRVTFDGTFTQTISYYVSTGQVLAGKRGTERCHDQDCPCSHQTLLSQQIPHPASPRAQAGAGVGISRRGRARDSGTGQAGSSARKSKLAGDFVGVGVRQIDE
ncbi:hypothetical protein DM02DRAFT_342013 [Periconia macrospinosa]|uniref:Uncharacterized protein n=1 Tax=Periconia macrospinosa TaxID=97972 RepID=A0A2V1D0D0_9PLEO|nr:hypothetical protein DM02DRAFT_342013 [Periconia macrospinosa]